MNNLDDFKASIDNYAKLWDDAVKREVFPKESKQPVSTNTSGFFGASSNAADTEPNEEDQKSWQDIHKMTGSRDDQDEVSVLHEEAQENALNASKIIKAGNFKKWNPVGIAKKLIKAPNPVRQSTTGPDQSNMGETYTNADLLRLEELKVKLYELECELNESDSKANNKKSKKLEDRLKSLSKEINTLSDSLDKGREISQQGD